MIQLGRRLSFDIERPLHHAVVTGFGEIQSTVLMAGHIVWEGLGPALLLSRRLAAFFIEFADTGPQKKRASIGAVLNPSADASCQASGARQG